MSAIIDILVNCHNALSFVWRLLRYAGSFLYLLLQGLFNTYEMQRRGAGNLGTCTATTTGSMKLVSIPVLGGLHHRYVRVAA